MFGTSGIRGHFGETVTAELGVQLGTAIGAWGADRVVIGRDPRPSGGALIDALAAGLRQNGVAVIDVGVAATPTIARAVDWCSADAGVAVTASHNPATDNGFKCWLPSGKAFGPDDRRELEEHLARAIEPTALDPYREPSRSAWNGAIEKHVNTLVSSVKANLDITVVVDIGNGAGQITARALDELGCRVHTLNGQPDGRFPGRPSEPTADNCQALQTLVPALDASLGIAHDGDADRMMAVDEDGTWIGGDILLAIFATAVAASGDTVAAPVNTSLAVDDALSSIGASVKRTRVGDVFVAEETQDPDIVFGGEPSGTWIWPEETLCPDGPLAACKLAELIATGAPLSERATRIPSYPIRRISIDVTDKPGVMERVTTLVEDRYERIQTLDGVRVVQDTGWFLIRPSGTEPIVRITAEGRSADATEALLAEGKSHLEDAISLNSTE